MQVNPVVLLEPSFYFFMFMGRIIIHNQMKIQRLRCLFFNRF